MSHATPLSNALATETDKLLGCIHCGLCLPVCPTYLQLGNENDSPRGRIYLMRAVSEGRIEPSSDAFARHIDLCLGCRACETACPAGVRYGSLLEAAREEVREHAKSAGGIHERVLGWALRRIFPYPGRLRVVFSLLRFLRSSSIVNLAEREGLVRGISERAEFALQLLLSTKANFASNEIANNVPSVQVEETSGATGNAVTVFTGCVMEGLFKHTNQATARVLAANGADLVEAPTQVCCGALHAHSGDLETARELARRNIDVFEQTQGDPMIIVNAAGCGAMLKEYGELLKDDANYAERARGLSARVRDVSEYLAASPVRRGAEIRKKVTYDAPCHLYHAQRVTSAPQQLLSSIPGIEFVPLEGMQDCCGGAGIYNLTEPEMSESLLSDKIDKVKATRADLLVTANPGCHMQLGAGVQQFGASCRVAHVIDLVDESYRRAGFYEK
jgi:glycolate oxidase iron-sulfur subunit